MVIQLPFSLNENFRRKRAGGIVVYGLCSVKLLKTFFRLLIHNINASVAVFTTVVCGFKKNLFNMSVLLV